ncbi:MAG TPA: hypothetical protein VK517_19605 [Cyclobacteriaceae bacterium]|nr:hypothetical protein [Cyclobacteriaceae bacterium]
MYKKNKSFVAFVVVILLLVTCTKSDKNGVFFAATIDLRNSSIAADRTQTSLYFSLDDGATFTDAQTLPVGQKYRVKVVDAKIKAIFKPVYAVDWSASNPQPSDASSQTPEFTMQSSNTLSAIITGDPYCAFVPTVWTGAWGGDEVGSCCGGTDANILTQDATDPNKLIMDNFWGDHVDAYILFSASTPNGDQIVTIPEQTTSEGGTASGTGTYSQCYGTFTINTTYVLGASTYNWQYNFHR